MGVAQLLTGGPLGPVSVGIMLFLCPVPGKRGFKMLSHFGY